MAELSLKFLPYFLIISICAFIVLILLHLLFVYVLKKNVTISLFIEFFVITNGFALLGFSLGSIIGLSRSPVIAALLPAFLTFMGGFLIYIFVQKDNFITLKNKIIVSLIMSSLSVNLIFGVELGSIERKSAVYHNRVTEHLIEMEMKEFEHLLKLDYELFKANNSSYKIEQKNYQSILKRYEAPKEIQFEDLKKIYEAKDTTKIE